MKIGESQAIVQISNTTSHGCPFYCRRSGRMGGPDGFEEGVNHLIAEHGCTLLHVGGDTTEGPDGKPWHGTIAVLGSPVPLPEPPTLDLRVNLVPPTKQD